MKRILRAARALACALALVGGAAGPSQAAGAHPAPVLARPAPGHFAGKLELVPLFSKGRPVLRNGHAYYAGRNTVALTTTAGDTVLFFAGQRTDLASIPPFLWAVMPPDGPWAFAAVFHDSCYRTRGTFVWYGHLGRTRAAPYTRAECDEILRQGMVALGVPTWERVAIFEAVRVGGGNAFGT
jgi:hypothetical protein